MVSMPCTEYDLSEQRRTGRHLIQGGFHWKAHAGLWVPVRSTVAIRRMESQYSEFGRCVPDLCHDDFIATFYAEHWTRLSQFDRW